MITNLRTLSICSSITTLAVQKIPEKKNNSQFLQMTGLQIDETLGETLEQVFLEQMIFSAMPCSAGFCWALLNSSQL
jgi:hypothetical protein